MRSSVLLLAALCLCAAKWVCADTGVMNDAPARNLLGSSKKDKTEPEEQGAGPLQQPPQPDASSPTEAAPEREASEIFSPTTAMPAMKIIGPVVGGVIGAGALAGVIAISVMKKPQTPAQKAAAAAKAAAPAGVDGTLSEGANAAEAAAPAGVDGTLSEGANAAEAPPAPAPPPAQLAETTLTTAVAAGDNAIEIASAMGFAVGDTIKVGDEYQLVKGFGSLLLDHPMNKAQPAGSVVQVINDVQSTLPPTLAARLAPTAAPLVVPTGLLPGTNSSTAAPYTSSSGSQPSSGSQQNTVLAIACVLIACGLLSVCIVGILYFLFGKKKKRKTQPRKETPFVGDYYPEDQQPLNQQSQMSTMVDMRQQQAQDLCESQYMAVQAPPQQMYAAPNTGNLGSIPTMQNVVPMQTMPPPPPPPMSMSYAPPMQGGGSLFSQGSYYQNASPLANTVSALPTTQFSQFAPAGSQFAPAGSQFGQFAPAGSQYGLPPTIY